MTHVEWKKEFSVGIASIDNQHRQLINLINDLSEAMAQGKGNEVLEKIFDGIIEYAKTHFAYEEKLFDTHSFTWTIHHKAEHATLLGQARDLQEKFQSGKITVSLATLNFLIDWLKKHIMGSDKYYSEFLIARGVG